MPARRAQAWDVVITLSEIKNKALMGIDKGDGFVVVVVLMLGSRTTNGK